MLTDAALRALCAQHGLNCVGVTWEDTGRYQGSSVGPNISDLTIQVRGDVHDRSGPVACMPVIRHPNFSDRTADLPIGSFRIPVGNESGKPLRSLLLEEVLGDLRSHLHRPASWKGVRKSLLAKRDTHVLVSAQACFLPVPRGGEAVFNPVLFNYQSREKAPAVLTILVTPDGSSMTIIDNERDQAEPGNSWGQRLFLNLNGQRASLIGRRASDVQVVAAQHGGSALVGSVQAGMNMVLIIQVPLKQKPIRARAGGSMLYGRVYEGRSGFSDIEDAVIGHGVIEGPFTEIADLAICRDNRFPIRATVQFYKATTTGVAGPDDIAGIAAELNRVYADADYVGSLVQGSLDRPTAPVDTGGEPPLWWHDFWLKHRLATGETAAQALHRLRTILGRDPEHADEARTALN